MSHSKNLRSSKFLLAGLFGLLLVPASAAFAQDESGPANSSSAQMPQGSSSESVKQMSPATETPGQKPTPEAPPHKFSVAAETVNFTTPDVSQNVQRFSFRREQEKALFPSYGGQGDVYEGKAVGQRYNGVKAFATGSLNPREGMNIDLAGGANQISYTPVGQTSTVRQEAYLHADAAYQVSPRFLVRAHETHDLLYSDWVDPALARTLMLANVSELNLETNPDEHWHGRLTGRNAEFTDHNGQNILDAQVLREVVSGPFSLWVGPGWGTLGYRVQTPAYWSPARKSGPGLRSELHFQAGRLFAADVNFNATATEQFQAPRGTDYFWDAHLRPVQEGRLRWALFTTHIESNDGGGNWTRNDVGVNLNYAL